MEVSFTMPLEMHTHFKLKCLTRNALTVSQSKSNACLETSMLEGVSQIEKENNGLGIFMSVVKRSGISLQDQLSSNRSSLRRSSRHQVKCRRNSLQGLWTQTDAARNSSKVIRGSIRSSSRTINLRSLRDLPVFGDSRIVQSESLKLPSNIQENLNIVSVRIFMTSLGIVISVASVNRKEWSDSKSFDVRQRLCTPHPQVGEDKVRLQVKACGDWLRDEPNDLVRLQVNGTIGSTVTTVVVDSADPSTTAPGNAWGNATHLKPGDLLLVEPSTDNATFNHEIIEVTSVTSATAFEARRGAAGTTAATITNDLYLLKIGSNYAEGTAATDSASRNPIKYFNYTQIFKDTYEVTGTASQTQTRTGDVLKN